MGMLDENCEVIVSPPPKKNPIGFHVPQDEIDKTLKEVANNEGSGSN